MTFHIQIRERRYSCGGQTGNYGDYVSRLRETNSLWLAIAPPGGILRTAKLSAQN
jgi:hypothetical protein